MRLTTKLLGYLHRVFNKDPMVFLALRITCDSGQMTWTIADGVLTLSPVGGIAQPLTIVLSGFTIQELSQFVALQSGYSVLFQDMSARRTLSSLVLNDASGDISQSNGDHLFGYTNLLYSYINANASELELAQSQIANMLEQMSTTTAQAEFLDFHGTFYFVPRNTLELDPSYSPRIISNVLLPSNNNIGMAIALEAQFAGTSVLIVDAGTGAGVGILHNGAAFHNGEFEHNSEVSSDSGGLFDVTFTYEFSAQVSFLQFAGLIILAVNKYRASGTYINNLVLKNGPTATVPTESFNIGPVLVTVLDQAVFTLIETQSGAEVITESGSATVVRTESE